MGNFDEFKFQSSEAHLISDGFYFGRIHRSKALCAYREKEFYCRCNAVVALLSIFSA